MSQQPGQMSVERATETLFPTVIQISQLSNYPGLLLISHNLSAGDVSVITFCRRHMTFLSV